MAESQVNASTADTDAAESAEAEQGGLERKMETRHLTMISLGGVIGTGLFLSSGYTIHQAGPLGAIIAYGIGSMLVYFVMLSLGELSVAMPYAGSFHLYAKPFHRPRHRVHHRRAVLAELGGGARFGIHGSRSADATLVS